MKHGKWKGKTMYRDVGNYNSDIEDNIYPHSIFCLDTHLIREILRKMGIKCCRCGWDEGTCDFHHIDGRKIQNANSEHNISLVCPNCHRLINEGKVKKEELTPLFKLIGRRWKNLISIYKEDDKIYYILKDNIKNEDENG